MKDWARFLQADPEAWNRAREASRQGPRILMATSSGGHNIVTIVESVIAAALTMRGANVSFLMCDEALPACLRATVASIPEPEMAAHGLKRRLCGTCWSEGEATVGALGLPVLRQSLLVEPAERQEARRVAERLRVDEIRDFLDDEIPVGEHATAGTLRYYARGDLGEEAEKEAISRRYLEAALLSSFAMRRALEEHGFEKVVCNHGIYVPFGVFGAMTRARESGVVNWCVSYRKQTFIFSHGDTYHHTLLTEPTSHWEELDWSSDRDAEIGDYLKSRWQGRRDWIYFHEKPELSVERIVGELGIDTEKPLIGLLTNVIWDAQLHYPANAFPGIVAWVVETIRYFAARRELQLVIRVHPAEVRGTIPSRQRMNEEIRRHFPELPSNVFIIDAESPISTYAVLELCNAALIYGTKMGVELTAVGLPVIVSGEAWIRNKGLTRDVSGPDDYRRALDELPFAGRLDEATTKRARKYAYHFFFRRMIPLYEVLSEGAAAGSVRVRAQTVEDLLPGRDAGLDVICGGIMNNAPFIYDGPVEEPPSV